MASGFTASEVICCRWLEAREKPASSRQSMEHSGYHWDSRVEVFTSNSPSQLAKLVNEFYKNRFVVGTQVFPLGQGELWTAFVYYKVKV